MDDVRVFVDKVLCDTEADTCVVLLKEEDGERVLPIWIGQAEAFSIAMAQEKVKLPRPITHDLVESILKSLEASLEWVQIVAIEEGTFFAVMRVKTEDGEHDVDCRPSDAVAVAMRTESPIFVAEMVMKSALDPFSDLSEKFENISEEMLADLPDEVFGKYKM